MEKYTMEDLFAFMDAKRPVRVTCTDGRVFEGPCWAYGDVQNEEEYGVDEPSLEVQDTMLFSRFKRSNLSIDLKHND